MLPKAAKLLLQRPRHGTPLIVSREPSLWRGAFEAPSLRILKVFSSVALQSLQNTQKTPNKPPTSLRIASEPSLRPSRIFRLSKPIPSCVALGPLPSSSYLPATLAFPTAFFWRQASQMYDCQGESEKIINLKTLLGLGGNHTRGQV